MRLYLEIPDDEIIIALKELATLKEPHTKEELYILLKEKLENLIETGKYPFIIDYTGVIQKLHDIEKEVKQDGFRKRTS